MNQFKFLIKNKFKSLKFIFIIFASLIAGIFAAGIVMAWNSPTANPPNSAGQVITISTSGNVGIGTATPTSGYKLDVVGSSLATSWEVFSDIRFKKDIIPIANILPKLNNITPVSFNWIDKNKGDKRQIGFIAQEIEKEFPELVATDDNGYKAMDYSKMTSILLGAVKELKSENDSLKARIEKLELLYALLTIPVK